ncbi:peptidoglycan-binding protein [Brachybacterium muris]|uniref:peptidoglycan-binding domain-containing protein n=1 Tax=Brachybacterium muris TaxID=219301 RepID=UPI0021A2E667|nr:peptidoglycan-binding domain-containing protein [Brachybacterium muris]MCT1430555.1 peptidoglycan-binding protein [Brachybacterium muris]
MHQARGSKAIEYNYFACPHGHVIEGRGNRQNAANGTGSANRAGQSCQVLVGDTEALSAGHLRAMTACAQRVEDLHPGITSVQYGHRHWVPTPCPGSAVMSAIPIRPGKAVATAPTAKADPERPWLNSSRVKGMTAEQVRAIQTAVGVKVDGKYGDATGGAVKALQEAVGLTADGIYGPTTEEAMTKLDDISKKLDQLPKLVWGIGGGPNAPMINRRFEKGSEYPETTLGSMTDRIVRQHIVPLRGEVAGLAKAIEQIGKGEPVDLDAVRAAARAGVADALGDVTADVQVTVKGE